MKIVFVVPNMVGGGTERIVSLLANEYVRRGQSAAVLLFAGDKVEYPLDERVEVVMAGSASGGSLRLRLKRIKKMRKYYLENRDCIIFAFSVMGAVFSSLATIGSKHPMLVSERSNPEEYEHKWIRDFFYRRADCVVLQTEEVKKAFGKAIRKKAVVIPNPADPELPSAYEGKRKKKIASVGRLEYMKNQKLLLEAFALFQSQFPDYSLELYGKGSLEQDLRALARGLQISDKVHFNGFCPDVRERILDSAMFVLPSKYEGISNALLEALLMGIPVIATDCPVGGTRMCIKDRENGIIVPVDDSKAMADAMQEIAADEALAKKLSENGTRSRKYFSIEKIAGDFLEAAGVRGSRHADIDNKSNSIYGGD